jgi:hypothetical protein
MVWFDSIVITGVAILLTEAFVPSLALKKGVTTLDQLYAVDDDDSRVDAYEAAYAWIGVAEAGMARELDDAGRERRALWDNHFSSQRSKLRDLFIDRDLFSESAAEAAADETLARAMQELEGTGLKLGSPERVEASLSDDRLDQVNEELGSTKAKRMMT